MFKVGDKVYQVLNNKTIPKGSIGEVLFCVPNKGRSDNFYEIEFNLLHIGKVYRLRYEAEIAAVTPTMVAAAMGGPLPVGPAQAAAMIGKPAFKIGDKVSIIKTSSSYWSQVGEVSRVDVASIPWIYNVCFGKDANGNFIYSSFYEKDLIPSTRPMPQSQHSAIAKALKAPGLWGAPIRPNPDKQVKTKGACCCGALHTSNPNCHAHWCDAS